MSKASLIVIGEMNIDIVVSGLPRFAQAGQLVNGDKLTFGPGGKSRNIAAMAGMLMPTGSVAMISKTVEDEYGLWQIPVKALQEAGVNTDNVRVLKRSETDKLPGFAVVLVDKEGHNQILGAPGITRDLGQDDVDAAESLFREVGSNHGFVAFIGNSPMQLAQHIVQKAVEAGVRVLFDPGGADNNGDLRALLNQDIFLFKPNEHEAEELTGVKVTDFDSANSAAAKLRACGVQNVLITAGVQGAYLFSDGIEEHIAIPEVDDNGACDETGCGDQVMAAICAFLSAGEDIKSAATKATLAGTLQFHREGVQPVGSDDITRALHASSH